MEGVATQLDGLNLQTVTRGGWEYTFVSALPDEYFCQKCVKPLREPQQIAQCGHRFCKVCLDRVLRNGGALCPIDRQVIEKDKVFKDAACERAILAREVKCSNEGCQWKGELRYVEDHRSKTCPHELLICPNANCGQKMPRQQLHTHSDIECPWRTVACKHCRQRHPLRQEKDHLAVCRRCPITCVNNCGKTNIPREEMEKHLSKECRLALVSCEYKELGCRLMVQRENLQCHLETSVSHHMSLACHVLANSEEKAREAEQKFNQINNDLEDIENRVARQEMLPGYEYGKMMWKIDNYTKRLADSTTNKDVYIYSDNFSTGRWGYKMRACVKLNGDNVAENTHLSVYIIICRSLCDSLLPWPFNKKVKISLMDQKEDFSARDDIAQLLVPDHSECWQRPKNSQNIGVGIWKFASHEVIGNQSYLKDDTIMLKIEVEPYDILGQN